MKATVVNTVDNTTRVIENLPNGIVDLESLRDYLDIDNGQIFEGTTRTNLTEDSQYLPDLPENRRERGYVFFVSPAQSKIKNGALDRKACYERIKALNLGEDVKQAFGRNFTQVATDALNLFLKEMTAGHSPVTEAPVETFATETSVMEDDDEIVTEKDLWLMLADMLNAEDSEENADLRKLIDGINKVFPTPYSVQDLQNMRQ